MSQISARDKAFQEQFKYCLDYFQVPYGSSVKPKKRIKTEEINKELLEALQEMIDACYSHDEDSTKAFQQAKAAIKKATA